MSDAEMTIGPLSLVSIENLFNEIRSRHKASLLVVLSERSVGTERTAIYIDGGQLMAIGLARYAEHYMLDGELDSETEDY